MEKSLSELMEEAYNLSLDLCFETLSPDGHCFDPREEIPAPKETTDIIWAWCDGLIHQYYEKITSGRCSLRAMIDFDIAKFEEEVIANINTMKALLKQVGMPRKLTFHEMQIRGYKGKWAGEFKLLTFPNHAPFHA